MEHRIKEAYKNVTAFLLQPHCRDQFIDKDLAIALYNTPLSLYIFICKDYYTADISQNRKILWIEEGHKYEE